MFHLARKSNKKHSVKCHWNALSQILSPFAHRYYKFIPIWKFPWCWVEVEKVKCSWACCFSPAGYTKYNDISVIITSQNKFEQLWGWTRTLFTLRLWESECVSVKENFKQLEELRLHSEANPNPRVQQSCLDFPWPQCSVVMQPCGRSSFISKHVLHSAQRPRGTVKWLSHLCMAACGEPLRAGHRVQRKVNGKGQDAYFAIM